METELDTRRISMKLLLTLISVSIMISGCSSKKILEGGRPMKDVYYEAMSGDQILIEEEQIEDVDKNSNTIVTKIYPASRSTVNDTDETKNYFRNSDNEFEDLFQSFDNPYLYVYIYPHVTSDGLAVPGYITKIRMFESDHQYIPYLD